MKELSNNSIYALEPFYDICDQILYINDDRYIVRRLSPPDYGAAARRRQQNSNNADQEQRRNTYLAAPGEQAIPENLARQLQKTSPVGPSHENISYWTYLQHFHPVMVAIWLLALFLATVFEGMPRES